MGVLEAAGITEPDVVRGRAKIGLDAIFTPARQTQALLNLLKNNTNIDLSDAKVEGGFTGRLEWEDKEECDVDNCGGGGREGGGYGCQHCCMFGTQEVLQGVRRSKSLLASRGDLMRDARMAELMQESMYDDGCV